MSYTNVAKPTGSSYTKPSKSPTDLPLYGSAVYGTSKYGQTGGYTSVSKPTGSSYTNINKPTT